MGDEDRDRSPSQGARDATQAGPPSSSPVISAELRQRIQAPVTAERSDAAAQVREPEPSQGGEVTTPAVESEAEGSGAGEEAEGSGAGEAGRAGQGRANGAGGTRMRAGVTGPGRVTLPGQTGQDGRPVNAGPVAEDEITEWLGTSVGTQPGFRPTRAPDGTAGRQPAARSKAWLLVLLVAAFVIGSLTAVAVRHFTRSTGSAEVSAAVARQEAEVRSQTAAWVAQQVGRDVMVACDRVMCDALTAHGFPPHHLIVVGPTSPDPVTSGVVVETVGVRSLFGTSLATAWAPAVLASFGSGTAAITVRVIAPHGAAAYQTALRADLVGRKTAAAALLNDSQITIPALAGEQLTAGQVDSRLLLALRALAGHQPIRIMRFGSTGPGSSAGVPLRFVDLAENDQAAHLAGAAYVRSLRADLSTVNARFRPARMATVVLENGQAALRVEVNAPSPLGLFGAKGSS